MINNPHKSGSVSLKAFFLNNARFLGQSFAAKLISIGYLIKSSKFYKTLDCPFVEGRKNMYANIIADENLANTPLNYLEFGVYKGDTINWWSQNNAHKDTHFVGFDTFTGLPEDWGGIKAGVFNVDGQMPKIDDKRCRFEKGLFSDTLPIFLQNFAFPPTHRNIVHLDADLYSSSIYVLVALKDILKAGDIIIFDEFFSITKSDHEFRAWEDFHRIKSFNSIPLYKTHAHMAFKIVD